MEGKRDKFVAANENGMNKKAAAQEPSENGDTKKGEGLTEKSGSEAKITQIRKGEKGKELDRISEVQRAHSVSSTHDQTETAKINDASTSRELSVILKLGDDCRQDRFCIDLLKLANLIWREEKVPIQLPSYECIATDIDVAMIQVCHIDITSVYCQFNSFVHPCKFQ
tara:strand:+ start:366 stop:869 length:504 start_codon:yes stop_codon:yes gene_type:complete